MFAVDLQESKSVNHADLPIICRPTFNPLAIKERLRSLCTTDIRFRLYFATLYPFEIKRLRHGLVIEEILHHQEVSFALHHPVLEVSDFYGIETEQLRKYGRFARSRIHVTKIRRS